MLLLSLIGVLFFTTSGYLLDSSIFSYTFNEILLIIKTSSNTPVWVYFVVIGLPVLFFYLSGKRIKINVVLLIFFAALTLSSFFIFTKLSLNNNYYHLKENKVCFFVKSVFKNQSSIYKDTPEDMTKIIEEFRSYFPNHQFVEPEYPFLYKAKHEDVLSPFFNLHPEPPNFVIVIIEGMGYEHLYNDYRVMPFLDSISKLGLSWTNCFSTSPRTFGVLPALLGNSPIGVKGFLSQCPYNPEFLSLTRILYQKKYTNYFFHGGKSSWLKMDKLSKINEIIYLNDDEWDEDIKKETIGSEWGFEDHLIYKQALRKINKSNKIPRIDIYLSNTTHHPWEYPDYYQFQEKVKKNSQYVKRSDQEKEFLNSMLYVYGGFAYSDWALQQLIEGYQKREDYKNTIFIITGDHHYWSKQYLGATNYHVPLIIYSPMLKKGREMKGVASHRDITPTILSLLHENYYIETPEEVAWLNTALDTSVTFNANTFSYLQAAHGTCEGIIYKNYLYSEGVLDELSENRPRRVEKPDQKLLQKLNRILTLYKMADFYTIQNDALVRKTKTNPLQQTTVLDIFDTIAKGSHFAKRSELPVIEEFEGRNTVLYFDTLNKYVINFFNYNFVEDDIESFKIHVEFRIFLKGDSKGNDLSIGTVIKKDNKTILNASEYLYDVQPNNWYDYRYAFPFRKDFCEEFGKGCYLKVFLYNNNHEGYIDDIKVKFFVEKK
jgi:phosphoglycerol transferase MdoB-like AlkP superfamily enzyme